MAPLATVKAAPLPDIPQRLQQLMAKNRSNLSKARMWEFLLWLRDSEKIVQEEKVTKFVHTYQWKTKMAFVAGQTVNFHAQAMARVTALPDCGAEYEDLPDLTKAEAEEIFAYKFRWGKETSWDCGAARGHWKAWFDLVNSYLLFRPPNCRMEQKYVVAAIRTWEGTPVKWADLVLCRLNDEIQCKRVTGGQGISLYSAFFISCLCEGVPALPERKSPTPPSPPSPTTADLELAYGRAKLRIMELEKQLSDRKDKTEQIQERSVDYLSQINSMLKEKISAEKINADLKLEVAELKRELKRLQDEVPRREVVRPVMVDAPVNTDPIQWVEEIPPPTVAPIPPDELPGPSAPPSRFLSMETCTRLRSAEGKVFPQFNLHHLYEVQRDLFLIMCGKELDEVLTKEQFESLWDFSVSLKYENLFTEMLARKHLRLEDPFAAFVKIGDVGARIYLYYSGCEEQLQVRRSTGREVPERAVDWADYGSRMSQPFYAQDTQTRAQWRRSLEALQLQVKDEEYLGRILGCNLKRTYTFTEVVDFSNSHYIYNRERAEERIERYLKAIDSPKAPVLAMQGQVQFLIPAPGYRPRQMVHVTMKLEGSKASQRYLGSYLELFDDEIEQPVPTWPALAWILEDYGLSRSEPVAADLIYKKISGPWAFEPPTAVQSHPAFCPCERRHKWAPDATINSVEYNWPQIQGAPGFNTPAQCQAAYKRFFEEHRHHQDPVCYRAAIFCAALATWCGRWNFAINVNTHQEARQEFLMLLKLQYRPARWLRLVEAMAITHFIEGVHTSLINEFPYTRAGAFERFLRWQRKHNPQGVAQDEDLQRAIIRMEAKDVKKRGTQRSRDDFSDEEQSSSAKRP